MTILFRPGTCHHPGAKSGWSRSPPEFVMPVPGPAQPERKRPRRSPGQASPRRPVHGLDAERLFRPVPRSRLTGPGSPFRAPWPAGGCRARGLGNARGQPSPASVRCRSLNSASYALLVLSQTSSSSPASVLLFLASLSSQYRASASPRGRCLHVLGALHGLPGGPVGCTGRGNSRYLRRGWPGWRCPWWSRRA